MIGTSFGSVDGDHFTLPDFRGRVPGIIGLGSGLTSRTIGTSTGTETVTLNTTQIPAHSHTGTTNSDEGAHTHGSNAVGGTIGLAISDGTNNVTSTDASPNELNVWTTPSALTINSTGSTHTHTFTTANTGGGDSHNNMQPTLFCGNIFILYNLINY